MKSIYIITGIFLLFIILYSGISTLLPKSQNIVDTPTDSLSPVLNISATPTPERVVRILIEDPTASTGISNPVSPISYSNDYSENNEITENILVISPPDEDKTNPGSDSGDTDLSSNDNQNSDVPVQPPSSKTLHAKIESIDASGLKLGTISYLFITVLNDGEVSIASEQIELIIEKDGHSMVIEKDFSDPIDVGSNRRLPFIFDLPSSIYGQSLAGPYDYTVTLFCNGVEMDIKKGTGNL